MHGVHREVTFDVEQKIRLIRSLAGQTFKTKTGLPFTYEIHRDTVHTSRTDYPLPLSEFRKALDLVPLEGPGEINWSVRGPSYIWAILHDRRVRGDDW